MSDTLFSDSDLFSGDPLHPDFKQVCPPTVIAELTASERQYRVQRLIDQAHLIIDRAWEVHSDGKSRAAWCVLYSGGNDSTVLAHLVKHRVDYAIHCNTTIGIEETRQFVRETCDSWGLPLIEQKAPQTYRELVLERGFPGPAKHFIMYTRLKERGLEQARKQLITDARKERVMFIAGRRRAESKRRQNIPIYELRKKPSTVIWASPLAMWTKEDLIMYRALAAKAGDEVPFNPVTDALGMSGECLCGSFAKPDELDRIAAFYPQVAAEIKQLERDVRAAGHPERFCRWGHGAGNPPEVSGPLCTSCDYRLDLDLGANL